MIDEIITDPTLEELQALDKATRELLVSFFEGLDVHQGVVTMLVANAVGQLVHNNTTPDTLERSLAAVFKIIRIRAEGQQETVLQ